MPNVLAFGPNLPLIWIQTINRTKTITPRSVENSHTKKLHLFRPRRRVLHLSHAQAVSQKKKRKKMHDPKRKIQLQYSIMNANQSITGVVHTPKHTHTHTYWQRYWIVWPENEPKTDRKKDTNTNARKGRERERERPKNRSIMLLFAMCMPMLQLLLLLDSTFPGDVHSELGCNSSSILFSTLSSTGWRLTLVLDRQGHRGSRICCCFYFFLFSYFVYD